MNVEANGTVATNGAELSEDCCFKILKANIPPLPDWLFKRPNLNHNSITSLYQNLVATGAARKRHPGGEERPKEL